MMTYGWLLPAAGGALLGLSASLMLLFNGRVTGISGIINGVLHPAPGETAWRWYFLAGLFSGGFILKALDPQAFGSASSASVSRLLLAGVLVGFGATMGSGCTSGHGVCGISRLSPRSVVATLAFMISGILAVTAIRELGLI